MVSESEMTRIVNHVSRKFCSHFKFLASDIKSEAILGILLYLKKNETKVDTIDKERLLAILGLCAKRQIINFLRNQRYIKRKRGLFMFQKQLTQQIGVLQDNNIDLQIILLSVDFTQEELFIIKQRLAGYSFKEIADFLFMSKSNMTHKMNKIREKYKEYMR